VKHWVVSTAVSMDVGRGCGGTSNLPDFEIDIFLLHFFKSRFLTFVNEKNETSPLLTPLEIKPSDAHGSEKV